MFRIDTHHHLIPPVYRAALGVSGVVTPGGRSLPEWSAEQSLDAMARLNVSAAMLSVSAPGATFLADPADSAKLASRLNDYGAQMVSDNPARFGYLATLPTPHVVPSVDEAVHALDVLRLDGVVLLANAAGVYLGEPGLQPLWRTLDDRAAVVFVHPAEPPGTPVKEIPPFAADFLLDTVRAAYLLVRNGIVRDHPKIRFLLAHGGGFLPYAAHRLAIAIADDTGRDVPDVLADFRSFYLDTALTSSSDALPTLLRFGGDRISYGSDAPFAPPMTGEYFTTALQTESLLTYAQRRSIDYGVAAQLFPRLANARTSAVTNE